MAEILNITDFEGMSEEDVKKLEKLPELLKNCYNAITNVLEKYMDMDEKEIVKCAVWTIGANGLYKFMPSYPYLFINASKGSGKSRLMKILSYLCNGRLVVRPSEVTLFRTSEPLFIDEFEQVGKKETKDIRELLNSAYKRGATVPRAVKVEEIINGKKVSVWNVIDYPVYKPIGLANIWGMDDVLGDRCLITVLERSNSNKTKKIENFEDDEECLTAKTLLNELLNVGSVDSVGVVAKKYIREWNKYVSNLNYTTTLTTLHTLYTHTTLHTLHTLHTPTTFTTHNMLDYMPFYKKLEESNIYGREIELGFPLLIIAYWVDENVFDKLLSNFTTYVKEKFEEQLIESKDIALLDFVSKEEETSNFIPLSSLIRKFEEFLIGEEERKEEMLWLNSQWMTNALKRTKLVIEKRRVSRGVEVVLNYKKAKERIKIYKPTDEENIEKEN